MIRNMLCVYAAVVVLLLCANSIQHQHTLIVGSNTTSLSYASFFSIHTAKSDTILAVKCGNNKCFVTFDALDEQGNSVGYIVAQDNRTGQGDFKKRLDRAWIIASHIHRIYNVSTLLLGPSETILKDRLFVDQLNRKLTHHTSRRKKVKGFSAEKPLVVQKSIVMLESNQFWHKNIAGQSPQLFNDKFYSSFVKEYVKDVHIFGETIQKDVDSTKNMLREDLYPCLLGDYQFFVDLNGHIHHVDLDRCFDNDPPINLVDKDVIISFIDTIAAKYKAAVDS